MGWRISAAGTPNPVEQSRIWKSQNLSRRSWHWPGSPVAAVAAVKEPVKVELPGARYVFGVAVAGLAESGFAFAAAVYDSDYTVNIRVQRFDAQGRPIGAQRRIGNGEMHKPELIDRPGGGWMLAWNAIDSAGIHLRWQAFDSQGEPLGEAQQRSDAGQSIYIRMRHFPGGRIYIDPYSDERGFAVDTLGAPVPGLDSLDKFTRGLVADSSRGLYYGLDYKMVIVHGHDGAPLRLKSIQSEFGSLGRHLLFNHHGDLILFSGEFTTAPGADRAVLNMQSQVFKPF
jgi:hypothetical protein